KRYGAAIEQFQTALVKDPQDWHCRNSLAAIYMIFYLRNPTQDRLREQALEEWHQSLESNPNQPAIRTQIARWSEPIQPPEPREAPSEASPSPEEPAEASSAESSEAPDEPLPDMGPIQ
ncbi:unnamed protein product, partial [marine sediment metagenome]